MSEERQIELTWRCSACKNRNLGRHMSCESCGKPKDDSEEYEMPTRTEDVASVQDERLLRMATAGENWRCAYCESDQRALDGGCARCGAGRKAKAVNAVVTRAAPPIWSARGFRILAVAFVAMVFGMCVVLKKTKPRTVDLPDRPSPMALATATPAQTDFPAVVKQTMWSRSVIVQRWQLAPHEGFTADVPSDAVSVKAAGTHFHHNEEVYDHDETVYDEVEVPDGTRTETYSEREACGEDCTGTGRTCRQECTSRPQNCREVCSNSKNGFASCRQVCSGGGQDCREVCSGTEKRCTTRYCDRTKTRSVPKTRKEKRPRVVKKYRTEARTAPWSTYQAWEWVPIRQAEDSGDGTPTWPDAGASRGDAGGEREVRKETYRVILKYDDGAEREYDPITAEEFAGLPVGTTVQTRIYGLQVSILR